MDYESLSASYRRNQIARVLRSLKTLREVQSGRVVPDTEDLLIGSGRRLKMAVLFVDISGFSGRPSETEFEQRQNLTALGLFFTELVRIAEDYGGTVEKNTGDGLMAYFEDGGGSPAEVGPKRAVACALTMMSTTTALINPVLSAAGIIPLSFRIGIDYGWVTVARLGAAQRFTSLAAVGTTANIACKMLSIAGPDEIVIGDAVRHQLPSNWQQWILPVAAPTGWVYKLSGISYPFWYYTGRWVEPPS